MTATAMAQGLPVVRNGKHIFISKSALINNGPDRAAFGESAMEMGAGTPMRFQTERGPLDLVDVVVRRSPNGISRRVYGTETHKPCSPADTVLYVLVVYNIRSHKGTAYYSTQPWAEFREPW